MYFFPGRTLETIVALPRHNVQSSTGSSDKRPNLDLVRYASNSSCLPKQSKNFTIWCAKNHAVVIHFLLICSSGRLYSRFPSLKRSTTLAPTLPLFKASTISQAGYQGGGEEISFEVEVTLFSFLSPHLYFLNTHVHSTLFILCLFCLALW